MYIFYVSEMCSLQKINFINPHLALFGCNSQKKKKKKENADAALLLWAGRLMMSQIADTSLAYVTSEQLTIRIFFAKW